jgi:hypothetical protein
VFRIVVTVPAQIEGPRSHERGFLSGTIWVAAASFVLPLLAVAAATRRVRIKEANLERGTERFTATAAVMTLLFCRAV